MDKKISKIKVKFPDNLPIFYSDSAFVGSNKFGLVINFAQKAGMSNEQKVISRVGMSREHAEVLLGTLQANLVRTQTTKKK